jgi:hypothetical protein
MARKGKLTDDFVRDSLIRAGVKNLREFGYPQCKAENILTDRIYRAFFLSMLENDANTTGNEQVERVRQSLIKECER